METMLHLETRSSAAAGHISIQLSTISQTLTHSSKHFSKFSSDLYEFDVHLTQQNPIRSLFCSYIYSIGTYHKSLQATASKLSNYY